MATFVFFDMDNFFDALLMGALAALVLGGLSSGVGWEIGDAHLIGFAVPTMVFGMAVIALVTALDVLNSNVYLRTVPLYVSVNGCEEVVATRLAGVAERLYYGDGLWVYRLTSRVACYYLPFRRSRVLCIDLGSQEAPGCLLRYIHGAGIKPRPLRGDDALDIVSLVASVA